MKDSILYGIKDGKAVHITEIPPTENGKKCGCICPSCHTALMAKLGKGKRRPHFAHTVEVDCNPVTAQETGLHLLAKEILAENNEILLPGWKIARTDVIPEGKDSSFFSDISVEEDSAEAVRCIYDSVEIEKADSGIRADAVITIKGRPCAVEFAVTHFVDEQKTEKTRDLDLPMFEIDLRKMTEEIDREKIVEAVLFCPDNRTWKYNPKQAAALNRKKKAYREKADRIIEEQKKEEAERRAKKAAEREKEEAKRKKEEAERARDEERLAAYRALFDPEIYAEIIRGLRNDREAAERLKEFAFSPGLSKYPFFCDIPITGEFIFSCDRRIWQAALFDMYVFTGFGRKLTVFNVNHIINRIEQGYTKPIIQLYTGERRVEKAFECLRGLQKQQLLSDVIYRYFFYLQILGFVNQDGETWYTNRTWYAKRPVSLMPPKRAAVYLFRKILSSVDPYAPDVDELIEEKLKAEYYPTPI